MDHTQCDQIHNLYHQCSPHKWSIHSVVQYTRFISIISTQENHTQAAIHLLSTFPHWVGISFPSTLTSLGWYQACLPLPSLGWYQACLPLPCWGGIRLVWPAAESRSPGYISVCVTHVLTHLGPHLRCCQGVWTLRPEKPQNKNIYITLSHNFTHKTNFWLSR